MNDQATVAPEEAIAPLVLALDIGTSSARALIYDAQARMVAGRVARRPYLAATTPDGGVTLDPARLLEDVVACVDDVMAALRRSGETVAAVAYSNFWHSLLGVRSGQPVTPIYTFADTRSAGAAQQLASQLNAAAVHARTGAFLHSSYWPAKLRWLQDTRPDVVGSVDHWISFAEYLYLRLFGELRVSLSMASGTGLFDQNCCRWDPELLQVLHLDPARLSPLYDFSDALCGLAEPYAARWPELRAVPWYLGLGDGACNNVGSGGYDERQLVVMIGTSGAMRVTRQADTVQIPPGLWTYRVDRRRFVQGGAFSNGGNVFAWLEQSLRIPSAIELERRLAAMPPDAHGLTVLPFLAGERSPGWNPDARAVMDGMRLDTTPDEMARAWLEAVTYRFGLVYEILEEYIPMPGAIIGSGAALLNAPVWLRMMADVLGQPVHASAVAEASGRGAALLALEARGVFPSLESIPVPLGATYHPDPEHHRIYEAAMKRQQQLYRRVLA